MPDQPGVGRWDTGLLSRVMQGIVTVVGAGAGVVLPALLLVHGPQPTVVRVLGSVAWLALSGIFVALLLRIVTRLEIHADGRIEARRMIGTVTVHARDVTRITRPYLPPPTFGQERFRRTTIRTADRKVVLQSDFPDVPGVADAIRVHNPAVAVEL